jgi:leucyl-tRNA synthetase
MGVPAHDTRDHTFASHHKLSIVQVIKPVNETEPGTSNSFIQRFLTQSFSEITVH